MTTHDAHREHAVDVVRRLQQASYVAYWAGGCVRDLIRGQAPKDYDVATDALPEQVRELFGAPRTLAVGESFGVVLVLGRRGVSPVEVATFRVEADYADGRRPRSVVFSGPREDAQRRDFTINGMFFDPVAGEVHDFVGGRADLAAGVVRAIGDPRARMEEDKLRLLRAVRFASVLDFQLDSATAQAVFEMAPQIAVVSVERIAQELRKMLVDRRRRRAAELCGQLGLLAVVFPELDVRPGGTVDGGASPRQPAVLPDTLPFPDAPEDWPATLAMLEALQTSSWPLVFAVLLRRVAGAAASPRDPAPAPRELLRSRNQARRGPDRPGAPPATADSASFPESGVEQTAPATLAEIGHRLRLSNDDIDAALWLQAHASSLDGARQSPPAPLKRLMLHRCFPELLELARVRSLVLGVPGDGAACAADLFARWTPAERNPAPLVTGKDVLALGTPPGPEIREILEAVRDAQLNGEIATRDAAIEMVQRLQDG